MAHRHVRDIRLYFQSFLGLAHGGPFSAEVSSRLVRIWNSGMFFQLQPGVCETSEMDVMAVLRDSGFDQALEYMAKCRSYDVYWPQHTS